MKSECHPDMAHLLQAVKGFRVRVGWEKLNGRSSVMTKPRLPGYTELFGVTGADQANSMKVYSAWRVRHQVVAFFISFIIPSLNASAVISSAVSIFLLTNITGD